MGELKSGLFEKSLPHSEDSERATLAAVLLSPDLLSKVTGRLVVEDFYFERNQLIFGAMVRIGDLPEVEIDIRTLQSELEVRNQLETAGGFSYLAGLDMALPDLDNASAYIEVVKERSARRALILSSQRSIVSAFESGSPAGDLIAAAELEMVGLGRDSAQVDFSTLSSVIDEAVVSLEERAEGGSLGIPTGFWSWDGITQGLVKSSLIVIAGRPGMGKTSLAINVAQHVAIRERKTVAIFSLEMAEQELVQRMLSSEANIPLSLLLSGKLSQEQWRSLFDCARRIKDAPIFIDDSPNPSMAEVLSRCRKLQSENGLSLVILDYLQLMQSKVRFENRQVEIASVSRALKQLAKELDVPVMALSQLSRETEKRAGNHRPQLSDLRESGAIEQDADVVGFVYRDEMYNKNDPDVKGLAELIFSKHRNGATGTARLAFVGETTSFRNLERGREKTWQ